MSKGPTTQPRAPKLGGSEVGVASFELLEGPFGRLRASLGCLPSALVAPLPPRGLRGPALVDNHLEHDDPKAPLTAEMYPFMQ